MLKEFFKYVIVFNSLKLFLNRNNFCKLRKENSKSMLKTHIRIKKVRSVLNYVSRRASTCSGLGPVACKVYCTLHAHTHLIAHTHICICCARADVTPHTPAGVSNSLSLQSTELQLRQQLIRC